MRHKVIYISGKYTIGNTKENINKAREMAIKVWESGFTALCPHLNSGHFESNDISYDDFIKGDLELLNRCDAILMLPEWEESKGANLEFEFARDFHIPIFLSLEGLIHFYNN